MSANSCPVKRLSNRLVGHGRITIRDLLLLVGSVKEPEAYLETVFGWSFTRGSEFIKGAFAAWAALAVGAAALLWGKDASAAVVGIVAFVLVLGLLVFGFVFVNHDISHLHREWLASEMLLGQLAHFEEQVLACLAATAASSVPDHETYGARRRATIRGLEDQLDDDVWKEPLATKSPAKVGELLFEALGRVPTVHYEASQEVRRLTGQVLVKATALAKETGG